MKEGWKYRKIGDICNITDFVSNGSFASLKENVKYYYEPNYAILVRLADFSNGFNVKKFVYTDRQGYDFTSKSHLFGGELIMSNVGSVGSMFICPDLGHKMTLAPNTISIDSQNNKYLYYFFQSPPFLSKLETIISSATLKKFNKTNFKSIEIKYPPLSEQQRIVSRLDASFTKIDALSKQAEEALEHAKALFQAKLKELMEKKEGWEEKKLKDLCDIYGNYGLSVSAIPYNGVRYIRITDITDDGDLNDNAVSANIDDSTQEKLIEGDILFARTGATVGKTLVYRESFGDCLFAGYLIRYRLHKNIILPQFMFYLTHSNEYYKWVSSNQKAAAQPNISAKLYNEYIVDYPLPPEQHQIVQTLDSLSEKIKQLQQNYNQTLANCQALKQAILKETFE